LQPSGDVAAELHGWKCDSSGAVATSWLSLTNSVRLRGYLEAAWRLAGLFAAQMANAAAKWTGIQSGVPRQRGVARYSLQQKTICRMFVATSSSYQLLGSVFLIIF
jgi:hypothetical protein